MARPLTAANPPNTYMTSANPQLSCRFASILRVAISTSADIAIVRLPEFASHYDTFGLSHSYLLAALYVYKLPQEQRDAEYRQDKRERESRFRVDAAARPNHTNPPMDLWS